MSPSRRACLFFLDGGCVHVAQRESHRCVQFPESVRKCRTQMSGVSFDAQPLWEQVGLVGTGIIDAFVNA